ncbi:hypothetical protein [Pseudomonas sp. NPDC089401]
MLKVVAADSDVIGSTKAVDVIIDKAWLCGKNLILRLRFATPRAGCCFDP